MKGKLWDNCSDLFTVASWHYYPPAAMLSAAWNEEIKMDSLMSQKKKKKVWINWNLGIDNGIVCEVVKSTYTHRNKHLWFKYSL